MDEGASGRWGPPPPPLRTPDDSGPQRARFMAALSEVLSDKSYTELSVSDILVAAGASRRTFYEHFDDKLDCLLATYDEAVRAPLEAARAAFAGPDSWPEQIAAALQAIVASLVAEPIATRIWVVESLTVGEPGWHRHERTLTRIVPYINEGRAAAPEGVWLPPKLAEATVGSVFSILWSWVARGELDSLPDRLPDLVYMALAPFIGPREAARHALAIGP